jgi:uncharacterized protein (UPF0332 family)
MQMPPLPGSPTDERRFLKNIRNHAEFRRNLSDLSMVTDLHVLDGRVVAITACWMTLGDEHLADAIAAHSVGRIRATYSRAYYAAYNASKAVRYHVNGVVSLKGDDHHAAPELPDDFPDVDRWSKFVATLYEHRLRADYDNWSTTSSENSLAPSDCVSQAQQFLAECRQYLLDKFGVTL